VSKNLPFVKSDIPRDLRTFLDRVRELVNGSGANRLVGLDELTAAGVVATNSAGNIVPVVTAAPDTYLPTPAVPTNFSATSAVRTVIVEWDTPDYLGHAYAEVWSSDTDILGDAVLIGMSPGAVYVDSVGPSAARYYWARFVNTNNDYGPFNAVPGSFASTPPDLEYTMDLLAKTYGDTSEAPFFQLPSPLVIGGVTVPAGTYMKEAFIHNGVITNAKIGDLAVDNAKIANATIATAKIQDAAITTAKIENANITTAKIQDAAITNAKIGYAAIDSAQIQNAAITNAKIGYAAIDSSQLQDASIVNAKIGYAAITTAKIGNNEITFPSFTQGASQTNINPGSTVTLVTLTVPRSFATPGYILVEFLMGHQSGGAVYTEQYAQGDTYVYVDGSMVAGYNNIYVGGNNTVSMVQDALHYAYTSYSTITVTYTRTGGTAGGTIILNPSIFFIELKR
jgi:hypothetical protein